MLDFSSLKNKPYIIAELSSNHCNNLELVLKTIEAAARAGADAIKTQLFKAETLTLPNKDLSPKINDVKSPWFGQSLFDLYEEASLPYEWYPTMLKCASSHSIDLFASVFDIESVDFAISLNFPLIKISSFELIHTPMLEYINKKNLTSIISTGMASKEEIERCVSIFGKDKNKICLLKCTSDYPASLESTHIGQMCSLRDKFNVVVGLSDHSLSNLPSIIATTLDAIIIEKHFILDKSINSPDSFFSLDEKEFTQLVIDIRTTHNMLKIKDVNLIRQSVESHSLWERPSIYFSKHLKSGHEINPNDLLVRRPSLGLEPYKFCELIGKKLKKDVSQYEPVKLKLFDSK